MKIILSKNAEHLREPCLINYGCIYTVETNVRVKDVGVLDAPSLDLLETYYSEVNYPKSSTAADTANQQNHSSPIGDRDVILAASEEVVDQASDNRPLGLSRSSSHSSLASVQSSIFSVATGSSSSTSAFFNARTEGFTEQLVHLLLDDSELGPLMVEAIQRKSIDRTERNLARALGLFALHLRQEASIYKDLQASKFVKAQAKNVAHSMCAALSKRPQKPQRASNDEKYLGDERELESTLR